jgi:hypothetical protein
VNQDLLGHTPRREGCKARQAHELTREAVREGPQREGEDALLGANLAGSLRKREGQTTLWVALGGR